MYFSKNKHSVGVIAADTFRPGALAQIKTICEPFNIEIFGKEEEKKAGKIIKNGIEFFKKSSKDVIIIDTSGRHKEEKALLDEIKQLSNEIKPDHIFLVNSIYKIGIFAPFSKSLNANANKACNILI